MSITQQAIDTLVGDPPNLTMSSAYDGASRFDNQIAEWSPGLRSADADMVGEKGILDARARDMARNDAYIQAGSTIHKDSIVGTQFILNSTPDWKALGQTEDWATTFQEEAERMFSVYANSHHRWVDASRQNDFTGIIRLAVGVYTFGGEALGVLEWVNDGKRGTRTAIQMVDTDRLSTPDNMQMDSNIRAGVVHDKRGVDTHYHIRVEHPSDVMNSNMQDANKWKKVAARKPWGRQQVIYLREQIRVDQTRGVADMVAGLKEIAITRKFRDVTLQNAIVNASYAASIESELPSNIIDAQMGATSSESGVSAYSTSLLESIQAYNTGATGLTIDGARIPYLHPGTRLNMQPAGTVGGVGQDFERSLLRYTAASLGVSYEELSRDYSKTNLSSARAGMLNTKKFMQSRKKHTADYFASSIYRAFLEEKILNNEMASFPAKNAHLLYTNGHLNELFDALAACGWIGAGIAGQIDPLKEAQASLLKLNAGLTTREAEIAKDGGDYRKVFEQRARENRLMEKLGIEIESSNGMNGATGAEKKVDKND